MSENIVLTTGIYDLIKDHLRRRKTTIQEEEILLGQLKTAKQVRRKELPEDVVTINCEVKIKDIATNEEEKYLFVDAKNEKVKKGKYSILSPIGLATVGNKVGDQITWPFEEGEKKIEALKAVVSKYTPHLANISFPENMLKATGVIEIEIIEATGKKYE